MPDVNQRKTQQIFNKYLPETTLASEMITLIFSRCDMVDFVSYYYYFFFLFLFFFLVSQLLARNKIRLKPHTSNDSE